MLAKRGMVLDAVHYYSYPYTGIRSKEKVIELARMLSEYTGTINLHIVPFTEIQENIRDKCPEDHMTIIMRRFMMLIAEKLAVSKEIDAIITGESLGQVASQTIQGLKVTDAIADMPVFRPLIGMDKNDVISIARRIGTFETSILPYEDCCTVFNSKHPSTKPRLEKVLQYEKSLDIPDLVNKALSGIETIIIRPDSLRDDLNE
jgi:thiamine biosynthesis protein ThiI